MSLLAGIFAGAALLYATLPHPARSEVPRWLAGELTASAGFDFRSGSYDDEVRSDLWYFPFSLRYTFDHFGPTPFERDLIELQITVPALHLRGPASILTEGGVFVAPDDPSARDARGGLGDLVVRATYVVLAERASPLPSIELTGRIKLPTADKTRSLGTGEPAYAIQTDLYKTFGRITPLATLGYRFVEPSTGFDLRDSVFASVGAGVRLTERIGAGLLYDYWQAASRSAEDAHELFPYASVRLLRRYRIGPYAVIGLSRGSPDWGVGLQILVSIPVR